MAKFKRTNRATTNGNMEQVIVPTGDQALATGALVDGTTSYGIANGQSGVLSWDFDGATALGSFITAGQTAAQVKAIKVLQGTPKSASIHTADIWEVGDKDKVESGIIRRENIRSVTTQKPRIASYSASAVTDIPLTSITNSTEYGMNLYLNSVRGDRDWGDNDEVITEVLTTSATATSLTNRLDWVLQNMAYKVNFRSRLANLANSAISTGTRDVLALLINTAGGAGQALGTITCGTSFNIMTVDGTTTNYVADQPFINAIARLIRQQVIDEAAGTTITDQITTSSTVEVINLTTAGTIAAGAGNAAGNCLVVLSLDEQLAAYADNIKEVTKDLELDLTLGFRSGTFIKTKVSALEGLGSGRMWGIEADDRAQLQVHTKQNQPHGEEYSKGKEYIDETALYTSTIIDYYDWEDTLTTSKPSEKQLIILLEATAACVNVTTAVTNLASGPAFPATTSDTTTRDGLEASLGAWLDSAVTYSGLELKGDATTGDIFV